MLDHVDRQHILLLARVGDHPDIHLDLMPAGIQLGPLFAQSFPDFEIHTGVVHRVPPCGVVRLFRIFATRSWLPCVLRDSASFSSTFLGSFNSSNSSSMCSRRERLRVPRSVFVSSS